MPTAAAASADRGSCAVRARALPLAHCCSKRAAAAIASGVCGSGREHLAVEEREVRQRAQHLQPRTAARVNHSRWRQPDGLARETASVGNGADHETKRRRSEEEAKKRRSEEAKKRRREDEER
eukprot:3382334-Rhodomonas_salina.1